MPDKAQQNECVHVSTWITQHMLNLESSDSAIIFAAGDYSLNIHAGSLGNVLRGQMKAKLGNEAHKDDELKKLAQLPLAEFQEILFTALSGAKIFEGNKLLNSDEAIIDMSKEDIEHLVNPIIQAAVEAEVARMRGAGELDIC